MVPRQVSGRVPGLLAASTPGSGRQLSPRGSQADPNAGFRSVVPALKRVYACEIVATRLEKAVRGRFPLCASETGGSNNTGTTAQSFRSPLHGIGYLGLENLTDVFAFAANQTIILPRFSRWSSPGQARVLGLPVWEIGQDVRPSMCPHQGCL